MGQTVFGIMYGCKLPATSEDVDPDIYSDQVGDTAREYDGGDVEWDADLIGLWVAVGGSGKEHAADFNYATVQFSEKALRAHVEIGEFVHDAEEHWPAFVEHMREAGVNLARRKPKLWLRSSGVS